MITINLTKAKAIAHELRRAAREEEFRPYDEIIAKRLPGGTKEEAAAEAARQAIREKYEAAQARIDSAVDVTALKSEVDSFIEHREPSSLSLRDRVL